MAEGQIVECYIKCPSYPKQGRITTKAIEPDKYPNPHWDARTVGTKILAQISELLKHIYSKEIVQTEPQKKPMNELKK